jgi:hypothetical protein
VAVSLATFVSRPVGSLEKAVLTGAKTVKGPAGACSAVTRLAVVSEVTRLESVAVPCAVVTMSDAG